ncbi:MAG: DegT/DnrJ/EryC1/StrS aminotransferase family protein [Crocinitomicaceae bacterium]|nr:DegT/DnrJ/EryC1/StrS aminotransferase family protein [Crocinitomicaceae bacterium]MDG1659423.1 DegT/DnrJ/EryC1/StrS aminotransferase family protein [Crocinitomicaceae bacterium]
MAYMIPFSPPRIDDKIIAEVTAALQSGWITTGPRTKQFEKNISEYCGCKTTVAVNSWTMGMQVFLNYWGIQPGDEVIIPAYTYCASANVIVHAGAKPVMVDLNEEDFNLNVEKVRQAITPKTKAILAVDISGFPADYDLLMDLVNEEAIKSQFSANNDMQSNLGRIIVISDSAHSFGALMNGKRSGSLTDVSSFSFHAVKNLTTAEGGALCFNLPDSFDHDEIYKEFCTKILHGQNKDALAKTKKGNWKYDVEEPGFKCNMTDIQAAIGLVELERYQESLDRRKMIFHRYADAFSKYNWAIKPAFETDTKTSSYHLYLLRIDGASEAQRDEIIQEIFEHDVSVNVHFQPLPLLTAYKKRGYQMNDYPEAYAKYANEISLPVYFNLTDGDVDRVVAAVVASVQKVLA